MADQIGDIIKNITDDVKVVVAGELELAKQELGRSAKKAGVGGGMFAGAAVFALTALVLLIWAGSFGFGIMWRELFDFSTLLSVLLGFVTMAVLGLLIAGILALIGKSQVSKAKAPEKTIAQAQATVAAAKQAVTLGGEQVQAELAAREQGKQLAR
ncbi:phage holin family protein [Enemella sp. A6]|uniref:phage holin family protein n=1 Tax=Enemella sp. A6 TaxID=3440152 RepID=UPI003EB7ABE7